MDVWVGNDDIGEGHGGCLYLGCCGTWTPQGGGYGSFDKLRMSGILWSRGRYGEHSSPQSAAGGRSGGGRQVARGVGAGPGGEGGARCPVHGVSATTARLHVSFLLPWGTRLVCRPPCTVAGMRSGARGEFCALLRARCRCVAGWIGTTATDRGASVVRKRVVDVPLKGPCVHGRG